MTAAATPPVVARRRLIGGWTAIVVVLVGVGIVGAVISGILQWAARDTLDPESAGADGTRALARILTANGVDVEVVRDRQSALGRLADGGATLVLPDSAYLSDDAIAELADAATDAVMIDPSARGVRLLFPGSTVAGFGGGGTVEPGCDVADAERAGPIVPGAIFAPAVDIEACYEGTDGAALLVDERGSGRVAAVDATQLFTNEHLAENGNAALAVNLLGRNDRLVWYIPSLSDSDLPDTTPTIAELTPGWVSPVLVLGLCAGLAAAVWRGRRFGPLVAENLPVTVRAAETSEGRARLYARAGDATHALDQLRIGALGRIGRLLGLGPAASAPAIADAATSRLGADPRAVRGILLDDLPTGSRDLVALADRVRDLEAAVRAAVRPERNTP